MTDSPRTTALDLPVAPRLRSTGIFGATAIFTALAIGSGELMFWPSLMLSGGAGVLLLALAIVGLQWVVNIEVARYSLATGQPMGEGVAEASRLLAFLLLLGAIVPWIWPGWVRSGGQLLAGLSGLPEQWISLASILLCALLLSLPKFIYPVAEKLQSLMLAAILIGVVVLFAYIAATAGGLAGFTSDLVTAKGISSASTSFMSKEGSDYYALLGGVVFAGAGGILNLGYGLLMADKGAGMGYYQPRLRGITYGGDTSDLTSIRMDDSDTNRREWKRWIRLARTEHGILFVGGNGASIIFISAIFYMLYAGNPAPTSGISLLVNTYELLGERYGAWTGVLFAIVGFLVFFTSALGILHVTSRIAAGIARSLFGGDTNRWFHGFVWGQFAASCALILIDTRQPFWLLVTSAVLNTLVMALYSFAILWLNRRALPRFARAPLIVEVIVATGGIAFGSIFLWTVWKIFG